MPKREKQTTKRKPKWPEEDAADVKADTPDTPDTDERLLGVIINGVEITEKTIAHIDQILEGRETIPIGDALAQAAAAGVIDAEPVLQQAALFPAPPYDESKAMDAILAKRRVVSSARGRYDDAKERAASARKILDSEEIALDSLILDIERQKEKYERWKDQPSLGTVDAPGCVFERRTGQPCAVCRAAKDTATPASFAGVQASLRDARWHLEIDQLKAFSVDQLTALLAWVREVHAHPSDTNDPPFGHPHIAGMPGDDEQHCETCDARLFFPIGSPFPVSSYVGMDCPGEPDADQARVDAAAQTGHETHAEA